MAAYAEGGELSVFVLIDKGMMVVDLLVVGALMVVLPPLAGVDASAGFGVKVT